MEQGWLGVVESAAEVEAAGAWELAEGSERGQALGPVWVAEEEREQEPVLAAEGPPQELEARLVSRRRTRFTRSSMR